MNADNGLSSSADSVEGEVGNSVVNNVDDSLAGLLNELSKRLPQVPILKLLSLTGSEFDEVLETIFEGAIKHIEKNANHYTNSNEEAISGAFAAYLNMPGLLKVTQESHSKGHVDITIETCLPPYLERLGEAKIYDGPVYHVEGLEQLVDRYSTGRDLSGFIVEYIKNDNIKGIVKKIREHLNKEKPCEQIGDSQDHKILWSFTTNHIHNSGETFRVIHLNCNLCIKPPSVNKQPKPKKKPNLSLQAGLL